MSLTRTIRYVQLLLSVCACLTLGDPMDYSLPDSSVHLIFLAKIAEGVAISSFEVSSQPKDQTCVSCISCISRQILYHCTPWEALSAKSPLLKFCLILRAVQKKNSCNKSCRTSAWPTCLPLLWMSCRWPRELIWSVSRGPCPVLCSRTRMCV